MTDPHARFEPEGHDGPSRVPTLVMASPGAAWRMVLILAAWGCSVDAGDVTTHVADGEAMRIERVPIATVTDSLFPGGAWSVAVSVKVLPDTTFLTSAFDGGLHWADRDGTVVRQVGGLGEGPGEFLPASRSFMWNSDTFYVMDRRLNRITRLSKDDLGFEGTAPMPMSSTGIAPVAFSDGAYVMGGRGDHPLHLVSSEGELLASFAGAERGSRRELAGPITSLAPSGDSAVWVGYHDLYRIELWTQEGVLRSVVEPESEWPFRGKEAPSLDGDPELSARIWGVYESPDGLLWVHIGILAEIEQEIEGVGPDGSLVVTTMSRPDFSRSESVVEVVDPVEGSVLASDRILKQDHVTVSPGGFFLQESRTTSSGLRVADIWGVQLYTPEGLIRPEPR